MILHPAFGCLGGQAAMPSYPPATSAFRTSCSAASQMQALTGRNTYEHVKDPLVQAQITVESSLIPETAQVFC